MGRTRRCRSPRHWLAVRRRNGTVRLKAAVREAAAAFWSVPEADLAKLVRTSGMFPRVMANPALVDVRGRPLTTPDLWIDDVGLAVMIHSRRFHAGVLDGDATVESDEDLRDAGVEVVAVTPMPSNAGRTRSWPAWRRDTPVRPGAPAPRSPPRRGTG
jgi:hypothetical protein